MKWPTAGSSRPSGNVFLGDFVFPLCGCGSNAVSLIMLHKGNKAIGDSSRVTPSDCFSRAEKVLKKVEGK